MTKQTKSETVSASASTSTPAPAQVKATKSEKPSKKVATAVAVDAPVASAVAPATVAVASAEKVSKKKEKKEVVAKTASAPTSTPAPAQVSASTDAVPAPAEVATVSSDFGDFMVKLQQISTLISVIKTEFRSLEKKASRELKTAAKANNKRKRKTGNRSPSGFVKPTLISDELASFLGKSKGTEMARTEVTREINAYIRANSLQDKTNGRRINADTKLSSLLKLNVDEELTYFNLQRYMSPHFAKSTPAVASAPATA